MKILLLSILNLLLIALTMMSCSHNKAKNDNIKTYEFNVKCPIEYPFTDFMHVKKVLELETVENGLIKSIARLKIRNDKIYIFGGSGKVHVFSTKGIYLNSIGKMGKGPGEIIRSSDFDISPDGNRIGIWDRDGNKLLIYNLEGDFIKKNISKDIKYAFRFCWLKENEFLLSSLYKPQKKVDGAFQAYLMDNSLNVKQGLIPYNTQLEKLNFMGQVFHKYDNNIIHFRHPIEGDIYEINENAKLKFSFNFGQYELNENRKIDYVKNTNLTQKDYMYSDHATLYTFFELKDWFYGAYRFQGTNYSTYINKQSGLQKRYRHTTSFDYLSDMIVVSTFENQLVAYIEPFLLKEKLMRLNNLDREKYKTEIKFWENIIKNKSETDNPILVFMKPRKF